MSQNRNTPPRTRPDLGRPTGNRRSRRDRPRVTHEEQEAVVEGVTGLRPEVPVVEDPYATSSRPGWVASVAAGGAAALAGWVVLAALASLAWLGAAAGSYGGVLRVATQVWLAGHGGGLVADDTRWTLVPYGLTLLLGVLLAQVGAAVLRQLGGDDTPAYAGLARSGLVALSYAAAVGLTGLVAGGPVQGVKSLGGALLLAGFSLWWARARTVGTARAVRWPGWAADLGRGLGVGLSVLVMVGSAALVTGLVVHRGQLVVLTEALGGGAVGGLGAVLVQAAYVPTFVVWAISYTLGAGFTLGDGSLVSPADTHIGLLPAWPVTAALPTPGPGTPADLAWLAGGLVAGAAAAWVALRRASWTRPDTTVLSGGLVGVLLGILTTVVGLLSRGDLGVARLAGLGPRPLELVVLGSVLMTSGGLLAGLVRAIGHALQQRRARAEREPSLPTDTPDPTPDPAATAPEVSGPVLAGRTFRGAGGRDVSTGQDADQPGNGPGPGDGGTDEAGRRPE